MSPMKKLFISIVILASTAAHAAPRPGDWIGSLGLGLTISPETFLLSPQLEYVHNQNLSYGALIQLGLASGTLVTISGDARYTFSTNNAKLHPFVEGALGLAIASGFGNNVGVHIMFGGGIDYDLTSDISVGTAFKFNFAPPVDNFFLSWPIGTLRIRF